MASVKSVLSPVRSMYLPIPPPRSWLAAEPPGPFLHFSPSLPLAGLGSGSVVVAFGFFSLSARGCWPFPSSLSIALCSSPFLLFLSHGPFAQRSWPRRFLRCTRAADGAQLRSTSTTADGGVVLTVLTVLGSIQMWMWLCYILLDVDRQSRHRVVSS